MRWSIAVAAAVVAAGCSLFAPEPAEYDYYVLTSEAAQMEEPAAAKEGDRASRVLVVGEVEVPRYLDREALVTRHGETRLVYSRRARWAEPLPAGIERMLGQELERRLAPVGVSVRRRRIGPLPDYKVAVEVLRFEARGDQRVDLWTRWAIRSEQGVLHADESRISEPIRTPGGAGIAAASSRAVEELAQEIAAQVRELATPPPSSGRGARRGR